MAKKGYRTHHTKENKTAGWKKKWDDNFIEAEAEDVSDWTQECVLTFVGLRQS